MLAFDPCGMAARSPSLVVLVQCGAHHRCETPEEGDETTQRTREQRSRTTASNTPSYATLIAAALQVFYAPQHRNNLPPPSPRRAHPPPEPSHRPTPTILTSKQPTPFRIGQDVLHVACTHSTPPTVDDVLQCDDPRGVLGVHVAADKSSQLDLHGRS